jgi:ubiquinone/menaquinone biosynthesis C-methylase UbiE
MDYIFSSHALQQLPFLDVPKALGELHRVLKPGRYAAARAARLRPRDRGPTA